MLKTSIHAADGALMLCMTGHAGYAPHGQDIVCAAASILATALENALLLTHTQRYAESGAGKTILTAEDTPDIRAMYRMTAIGLAQLAAAYPEHVSVCLDDFALCPQPP